MTLKNKEYKSVVDTKTGRYIQQKKRFRSSWNFSIYNAYNRENAYSITFEPSEANPDVLEATQLSLFKIIPSVSYNFNF